MIFLAVGAVTGLIFLRRPVYLTDLERWRARPQLSSRHALASQPKLGESGAPPCFFIAPPGSTDQSVVSGSVDDCLVLRPDGRKLDLFEMFLGGDFIHVKTDLYVQDVIPLAFTRTHRPFDDWSRYFQIYLGHVYDPFLSGNRYPFTYVDWYLPDGQNVHYGRVSAGTGYADAVYEHGGTMPVFGGSRVGWNGGGWDLSLLDGTTFLSPAVNWITRPQEGSLVGIFDKDGHEVQLFRRPNGDLTEVRSPGGHWIRLEYSKSRIIRARDNAGETVDYKYDSIHRLAEVGYSTGLAITYRYDSSNRIVRTEYFPTAFAIQATYDSDGKVIELSLGDGQKYYFRYTVGQTQSSEQVDITDSRGKVTRVGVQRDGDIFRYAVSKLAAPSVHR